MQTTSPRFLSVPARSPNKGQARNLHANNISATIPLSPVPLPLPEQGAGARARESLHASNISATIPLCPTGMGAGRHGNLHANATIPLCTCPLPEQGAWAGYGTGIFMQTTYPPRLLSVPVRSLARTRGMGTGIFTQRTYPPRFLLSLPVPCPNTGHGNLHANNISATRSMSWMTFWQPEISS